ncbi:Peptidoglycan/LPS O-acetylase OafA/YrhL, contains acyltransferase and SGNH-hydrolase domains [Hymenobacter arizonensis]|uniref:Peptidoglycan/LPS O-acetylase OafA/YrhL, contains acyltransferase and SGNH-hydrolase domains n=2 Tax=Hymenobacter arizonensis TaxID=1227077 RepID=A0A1I6BRX8_HYMAR|nr:Peptidoglycan/LPS O-acetylase OafA/YrhL, contains acyltransferase and SGNH-hydrolase domains [Hymenobacter arizonensis]
MVFFYHLVPELPLRTTTSITWAIRLIQQGYIGVNIFFVLSGFLITTRYLNRILMTAPWFWSYLQNRFARIYPVYLLLTVFTFGVMILRPISNYYEWPATYRALDKVTVLFLNLTLTRAYFQELSLIGVPTAWTLTVEETFYVCAPFLLIGIRRNFHRIYLYPLLFFAIGSALVAFCSHYLPYYGLMNNLTFMGSDTFFGRCVEFLVGMALGYWVAHPRRIMQPRFCVKATWLGSAGVVVGMICMAMIEYTFPSQSVTHLVALRLMTNILLPIPIAAMIWGLITEHTWLQRILSTKTFDVLGKGSYGFYLLHLGATDLIFSHFITGHWAGRLVGYTLLSIALYKGVEHPLNRRLRYKTLTNQR